jgi:hypothetical protein
MRTGFPWASTPRRTSTTMYEGKTTFWLIRKRIDCGMGKVGKLFKYAIPVTMYEGKTTFWLIRKRIDCGMGKVGKLFKYAIPVTEGKMKGDRLGEERELKNNLKTF